MNETEGKTPNELYSIGKAYEEGDGVEQDVNEAIKYFEIAAKNGSNAAFDELCKYFLRNIEAEEEFPLSDQKMAGIVCELYSIKINENDITFNKDSLATLRNRLFEIAAYDGTDDTNALDDSENAEDSDELDEWGDLSDFINTDKFKLSDALKDDDNPGLKLAILLRTDKIHYKIIDKILIYLLKMNDSIELNDEINLIGKKLIFDSGKLVDSNLDSTFLKLFIAQILGSFAQEGEDLDSLDKEWKNDNLSGEDLKNLYFNRGKMYMESNNADAAIADYEAFLSYFDDEDEDMNSYKKCLRNAYKLKQSTQPFDTRMTDYRQIIEKFKNNYEIIKHQTREEKTELAAALALFEEYNLLEKLLEDKGDKQSKEYNKYILNNIVSPKFSSCQPTPVYFVSTKEAVQVMKDPKKMLKFLVDKGADLNECAGDRSTALWNQLKSGGSLEIIQTLLELGADPDQYSRDDSFGLGSWRPLPYCLEMNYNKTEKTNYPFDEEAIKRAKIILEYGADPNQPCMFTEGSSLMKIFECGFVHKGGPSAGKPAKGIYDFIEFMIEKGADVNYLTRNEETPLLTAKKFNLKRAEEILIKHGALSLSENPIKIYNEGSSFKCIYGEELGYSESIRTGRIYEESSDYPKVLELFEKAGNAGCDAAFFDTGEIYFYGEDYQERCNIKKDRAKAFEYFKRAAAVKNKGYFHSLSNYYMGLIYLNGDCIKQDYESAFSCFTNALDENDNCSWAALECINIMFEKGWIKNSQYKTGAQWYLASDYSGVAADYLAKASIVHYNNSHVDDIFKYGDYPYYYENKWISSLPDCSSLKSQLEYEKEKSDSYPMFDEENYEKGIFWLQIAAQKGRKSALNKLCLYYKRNKEEGKKNVPSLQDITNIVKILYQAKNNEYNIEKIKLLLQAENIDVDMINDILQNFT